MGRGLSDLQKFILSYALESQEKGKNFLRNQEILREGCGWSPAAGSSIRATVEAAGYNTAHASLSRVLTRLWQRGLIEICKNITGSATAVSLTATGAEAARRIMANES